MSELASWKRSTFVCAAILFAAAIGCFFIAGNSVTLHLAQAQDAPVLLLLVLSVAVFAWRSPAWRLPLRLPPSWILLLSALAVAGALWFGAYAVFGNYPVARDEHMVVFDMAVYDRGRLAVPLEPFWRPYARALVPDFLLNDRMPTGLVSGYLPVNALLRLIFSKLADPAWFNPVLAFAGGAALLDISRRVFGRDDRAIWVVLLVYVVSAQMLVNAMTPFSMTGHMALNLLWLAAFLRGGKVGHSAAIFLGFLATGLHELVFHPFFAAAFILCLLRERQWRTASLYVVAYAVIVLWWLYYPALVSPQVASAIPGARPDDFFTKILPVLFNRTPGTAGLMVLNFIRFLAWQNFTLLPLLAAAIPVMMRERGLAAPLLLGIAAWLAFITFIEPYQGLGWGYRYLSGYLGSFALVAGYGYRELQKNLGDRVDGMVLGLSGLTAIVAIPLLLVSTHRFVEQYVGVERLVAAQRTKFVLIDTSVTPAKDGGFVFHPFDQVRNLPDLSNRPLRFSANQMSSDMLSALCRKGRVTLITRADMHRIGFATNVRERSPNFEQLLRPVEQKAPGCFRSAESAAGVHP